MEGEGGERSDAEVGEKDNGIVFWRGERVAVGEEQGSEEVDGNLGVAVNGELEGIEGRGIWV